MNSRTFDSIENRDRKSIVAEGTQCTSRILSVRNETKHEFRGSPTKKIHTPRENGIDNFEGASIKLNTTLGSEKDTKTNEIRSKGLMRDLLLFVSIRSNLISGLSNNP